MSGNFVHNANVCVIISKHSLEPFRLKLPHSMVGGGWWWGVKGAAITSVQRDIKKGCKTHDINVCLMKHWFVGGTTCPCKYKGSSVSQNGNKTAN